MDQLHTIKHKHHFSMATISLHVNVRVRCIGQVGDFDLMNVQPLSLNISGGLSTH
jgi:hypothetical protein